MGLSGGNGRHISRALDYSDSCWDAGRAVGVDEIGDRDGELVSPGMILKAPRSSLHAMLSSKQEVTWFEFSRTVLASEHQVILSMCQEVAHTFGLDHQSTDGSSLDTCMDYFSNTGVNAGSTLSTKPNAHDFQELSNHLRAPRQQHHGGPDQGLEFRGRRFQRPE